MKWTYLMYLPALVSALWALVLLATKKRPTRAQLLLGATMLIVAFAEVLATFIFRGHSRSLFIYQYLFQFASILAGPLYYISVCALTEPRGSSLRQRHSLILPLLFILALTIGVSLLGPRRYEHLCLLFRYDSLFPLEGDARWNFVAIMTLPVFSAVMVLMNLVLFFMASHKARIFQRRFNSYYADTVGAPKLNSRPISLMAWICLPLAATAVALIALRPAYAKYGLIVVSSLMAVLQFLVGRYAYSLNYDARHLAQLVKHK